MNFQLQSSPFKLQLSVLVKKDASCLDPPHEQLGLMEVTFDVLCAAQQSGWITGCRPHHTLKK